jgi:conjugal transfer pilus assembly protein TraK
VFHSQHLIRLSIIAAAVLTAFPALSFAQTAPNPYVANTALPGFVPAPPSPPQAASAVRSSRPGGSMVLQPSAYSDIPPPPLKPIPPEELRKIVQPGGGAHRMTNSVTPPPGFTPPAMPAIPPAPVILPNAGSAAPPSDLIDPSRLRDGTTAVSGSRIETRAGDTAVYLLKVSGTAPNLIQSPFANPRLLTTSSSSVQFKAHGRNLVVSVTQAGPVGVYVTGDSPGDPMIGLVLDPSPIPPRSYVLDVNGYAPKTGVQLGQDYVQSVVGFMRSVVEGHVPNDFSQTGKDRLPIDQMFMGVRLHPVREYVSPKQTIVVLQAKNENTKPVRLVENDFYKKGVTAVVIDPEHNLEPGQTTQIYVLSSQAEPSSALLGVWHGSDGNAPDESGE